MKTISLSFFWSDRLCGLIKERSEKPFPIECHLSTNDFSSLKAAINQGIDAHLEAVQFEQGQGEYGRIKLTFAPETLHVLVRRLMESGNENSEMLASDICGQLKIELI